MDNREPRSCAGPGGRTTRAIADRVAYQVSLACAPRPPSLRRGGTRDPATPPHPQRHPCRRGIGVRRPGHCPSGTTPPPDRWMSRSSALSPTGRARTASLGAGCDPRLRHGQRRGFRDPRLESGSPTAPVPPSTTFRQVALALLCRARRVPGNPRLASAETPPTIHDPIALGTCGARGSGLPWRPTQEDPRRRGGRGRDPSSASERNPRQAAGAADGADIIRLNGWTAPTTRCSRLGCVPRSGGRAYDGLRLVCRAHILGRSAQFGHGEPAGDWESGIGVPQSHRRPGWIGRIHHALSRHLAYLTR